MCKRKKRQLAKTELFAGKKREKSFYNPEQLPKRHYIRQIAQRYKLIIIKGP